MVNFFLTYGSDIATPLIRIGNFVGLMTTMLISMGIIFQIPVVLFFLSKIGLVSYDLLAKQRRYMIVVAFILGAIITPTFDPLPQALVALPIIVLYEVSIWIVKFGGKKKDEAAELGLDSSEG